MTHAPPAHLRTRQVQVSLASRDDEAEGLRSAAHNAKVKAAAAEAEVAQLRADAAAAAAERDAVAAKVEQLTVDLAAATAGSDLTDQRVSGLEEALRHAEERLRNQATVETEQEAQIAALSAKLEAAHASVEALKEQVRPVHSLRYAPPVTCRHFAGLCRRLKLLDAHTTSTGSSAASVACGRSVRRGCRRMWSTTRLGPRSWSRRLTH